MRVSMYILFCFVFFLGGGCSGELFARLEDHLRKITDKGEGHQIQNVDFIYMINLDERPEKLASCRTQLQPYGIEPYRFSAINGRTLSREVVNDVGVCFKPGMREDVSGTCYPLAGGDLIYELVHIPGRTYFFDHFKNVHFVNKTDIATKSLGVIGCSLSHLSVLQDAYDSGYSTIWVMEDDINVIRNPHLISACIDRLNQLVGHDGWDLLFTDQDTISNVSGEYVPCLDCPVRPDFVPKNSGRFSQRAVINDEFRRVGSRYGLYSVIIRRSGMKKVLDFAKKHNIFYPIDIELFFPSDIRAYTVMDNIVSTQRWAPSDNRET